MARCGSNTTTNSGRFQRPWRHLDFIHHEAWLHCDMPRVSRSCSGCGKTNPLPVPWSRAGSGFTTAFEALALTLRQHLPVSQAAEFLHCTDKAVPTGCAFRLILTDRSGSVTGRFGDRDRGAAMTFGAPGAEQINGYRGASCAPGSFMAGAQRRPNNERVHA